MSPTTRGPESSAVTRARSSSQANVKLGGDEDNFAPKQLTGNSPAGTGRAGSGGLAHQAEASDLPGLRSFASGIRHGQDAATAGLTLRHSSAAVASTVTKIKDAK